MGPSSLLWDEGINGGLRVVLPVFGCANVCNWSWKECVQDPDTIMQRTKKKLKAISE